MDFLKNLFKSNNPVSEKQKEINQTIVSFINKKKNDFDECVICLGEMKEGDTLSIIYCSHIFHKECIHMWMEKKRICPLCDQSF